MPAYLISTIEITDPLGYEEYKKLVAPVLAKYGGKFVVRGGSIEYKEGDWRPKRIVVAQFESMDRARAFYDSPEYAPAKQIRQRTSVGSVLFVEGA
jgi:uncharacterized protein (DUF1330 family)